MTSNYSLMNTPSPTKSLPPIYAADDNCMNITHIGTVNTPSLNLPHTYCVSNLTFNLVSVGQLCDLGLTVSFSPNGCQGTLVQCSCPHTSQQNGRVEHKHCHILDSNISLFEKLYGTPPNYSNLKTFGCACFVLLHPREHTKLEPRARLYCFLGYGTEHKGFRCWDPLSNRLRISRHVTFWEHTKFSRLSSFHTSFSSPQPFFTDTSIDLFPLSESPLGNELAQSAPTSATSDQSSISDDSPEPTSDTPPRRSTRASIDPLWQKAMNDELQALEKTHTWDYVDLPPDKRLISFVAAAKQWPLLQMDVKNSFLNGTLSEEVYMKPPPGTSSPPHKVCLLRRALYGLKQAPRAWFATFSSTITQLGFTSSPYDTALFTRHTPQGIVLLLLYVDDMIITGITDSNTASTPLDPNVHLTPYDGVPLKDVSLYRQLVGSLIYLTVTRPYITHVVHIVSQFMAAPRTIHFTAVLRILRYIKGTLGHGLQFSSQSSLVLSDHSDADWAGDPTDRPFATGYCFYLGDSLISWRSKKQSVVSRSSTESEYRALASTTTELLWLRWLLADMNVPQQGPTLLHCDNRSVIQIAHNDVFHERTKHIENDCHFIRHHLLSNTLLLQPVSTIEQPADIFTKALPSTRFNQLRTKLKLTATLPP
ncbi:putative mitochondrial protein [Cucumis melo var. makuwa]|uniref:Putative mitochondrial protein n=1 Tax=Cucumis melo var. makuwa TaxID=1194695 RepID=A0A5D3D4L0_CUCMM|nr:putative mitochondrial protein [Cucumis melo var. makuwa]